MIRSGLLITSIFALGGCKPAPQASDPEQVTGVDRSSDQQAIHTMADSADCDCAQLIPIKFRPDFPRVSKPETSGCRYSASDGQPQTLVVGIDRSRDDTHFASTSAMVQSQYVKIYDSAQTLLDDGSRVLVGVASEAAGLSRFAVVDLKAHGYLANVTESLSATAIAAPAPGLPSYLQGLALGIAGACPIL